MAHSIITNPHNNYGIEADTLNPCKIFAPIGTILEINGQVVRCTLSRYNTIDCARCVGRHPAGHPNGICFNLMCTKDEREDDTNVFFEVIDIEEETRKEARV